MAKLSLYTVLLSSSLRCIHVGYLRDRSDEHSQSRCCLVACAAPMCCFLPCLPGAPRPATIIPRRSRTSCLCFLTPGTALSPSQIFPPHSQGKRQSSLKARRLPESTPAYSRSIYFSLSSFQTRTRVNRSVYRYAQTCEQFDLAGEQFDQTCEQFQTGPPRRYAV